MDNRSRRERKTINYAALLDGDDSDDDFVASAAKPKADVTKLKIKPANTEKPTRSTEAAELSVATDSPLDVKPPKKSRLSLDEKLYQRNLEQALKMSVSEDLSISEPDLDVHNPSSQDTVLLSSEENVTTTPVCTPPVAEESHEPALKLQTEVPKQLPPRVVKARDSEDESDTAAAADLESSFSEDEPEKKPAKVKTAKPVRKKTKVDDRVTPRSPAVVTRDPCIKLPVWNPPNRSKDSKSLSSPASGSSTGLRLGLSRKARVKPLHPGVQLKI